MRAGFWFRFGTHWSYQATTATASPKTQAVDFVLQGPRALD